MRLVRLIALLLCAASISVRAVSAASYAVPTPRGPVASCPGALLIESTNGRYYIAVFEAHAPTRTSVDLTLYAKSAAYSLSLPEFAVDIPITTQNYTYRSAPAVIRNPGPDEFLGASVQPHLGIGAACPGENVIIPTVASLTDPARNIDPDTDALETKLASEAASAHITTPVLATGVSSADCPDAFADASVDQLVKPTLSDQQERDPGLLPAAVRVELDTTGNVIGVAVESSSGNPVVDAAIAEAARKTTYHPARFACQSERSSHVLRIDFSK